MKKETYVSLEQQCEIMFEKSGPFWHLYTPGDSVEIIFADREDMLFGINIVAICHSQHPEIGIYTFELMNNHVHFIVSGEKMSCQMFFNNFKRRLQRYLQNREKYVNLSGFNCKLLRIESLQSLRNEIVYVNRNGYVVNSKCTPYSYPWGSGIFYFNPLLKNALYQLSKKMTLTQARKLFKTREDIDPDQFVFCQGTVLPPSYCCIEKGEIFYRDAHHYFNLLSKSWEAYSAISLRLGDSMFLTDEEMYGAISSYTSKYYGQNRPSSLAPKDKIDVAKVMHREYHATNRQIKNILKLDLSVVQELFPKVQGNVQ